MTTPTLTNPRADRARFIESDSGQWLKCHTPQGKRYGIPSSKGNGRFYLVNTQTCDCPDFQFNGGPCKHVWAVRLHVARVKAAKSAA
jgi:predicted nucleic acid-binding Zn finger protein